MDSSHHHDEQYNYAPLPYQHAPGREFRPQLSPRKPVPGDLPLSSLPGSDQPQGPPVVLAVPPRNAGTQRPGILRVWTWEPLSLLASSAAFAAIVAVLRVYENKPLSSWKAPVSINTVVSILSTVFKGLLVTPISNGISQLKWLSFAETSQPFVHMDTYDEASRGAWGSLLFLAQQLRGKRLSLIASLGAFIALITLITDPFSQATVSINSCTLASPQQASIPRFNNYDTSIHAGSGPSQLSLSMQFAVLAGLYNPPANSSQAISQSITCPTGNCTFPGPVSLSTLTMCHSCQDISSSIEMNGSNYSVPGYPYPLSISPLSQGQLGNNFASVFVTNIAGEGGANDPVPWADGAWKKTSIFNFQGLAYTTETPDCVAQENCTWTPMAFDCSLRPVTNGRYIETELSRDYLHFLNVSTPFQLAVDKVFIDGAWMDCAGEESRSDTNTVQILLPASQDILNTSAEPPSLWYPQGCTFSVSAGAMGAFGLYLGGIFSKAKIVGQPRTVTGDAWLQQMWNAGQMTMASVDTFTEGLALSIGAEMRRNGSRSIGGDGALPVAWTRATGHAQDTEPCIRVHWPFLSFLAALLALAVAFVIALVVANHGSAAWQADWKSSTLPMLFHAIKGKERYRFESDGNTTKQTAQYYDMAKVVEAQLVEENDEWVFSARN
ncbi:hypothetical protein CCM_01418 [Cordyceps militaris CM01]|uniref:Uncharacterized protein n=1 Tax=Cordyceps militaris (strain CM01) TaxID=983644 RepID=G3J4Z7_CORMM|nr:uncharacterized protein CCM_01418 [Cordyceps militaris CM01]EGX96760.1 hypothetical protein CCM_01418 [Cordyceps militaris CM01]